MTFTFVCQNCDDSFELDHAALAESAKGLKCPSCGKRLPSAELDELVTSIDDVLSQVAALRKRFLVTFEVDAENLPAPYDADGKRAAAAEEEEDEESDDDALGEDEEGDGDDDDDDRS